MPVTAGTLENYRRWIAQFMEHFDWGVESVTTEGVVEAASMFLKSGLKPTTAERAMRCVSQFFSWREVATGEESPFARIKGSLFNASYEHTKERTLTEPEMQHFASVNGDTLPTYLVLLGFRTGMRLSDCCLLRFESIDFEQGVLQVICQKTQRTSGKATIPLALDPTRPEYDVTAMLLRQKAKFDAREPAGPYDWGYLGQNWVNPRAAGMYLSRRQVITKQIRQAFDRAGLKNRSHHSARHGLASLIVNSGINTHTAKQILGITSDDTLKHYVRPDTKFFREAVSAALAQARRRNGEGASIPATASPLLAA